MENNEHFCIMHPFHIFNGIFHIFGSIPAFLWAIIIVLLILLYTLGYTIDVAVKNKRTAINYCSSL